MGRMKDIAIDNLIQPEPEPEYTEPEPQWVYVLNKFSPTFSSLKTHSQVVVDIYSDMDMAIQDLRDILDDASTSTDTDAADYLYQITVHRIIKP